MGAQRARRWPASETAGISRFRNSLMDFRAALLCAWASAASTSISFSDAFAPMLDARRHRLRQISPADFYQSAAISAVKNFIRPGRPAMSITAVMRYSRMPGESSPQCRFQRYTSGAAQEAGHRVTLSCRPPVKPARRPATPQHRFSSRRFAPCQEASSSAGAGFLSRRYFKSSAERGGRVKERHRRRRRAIY